MMALKEAWPRWCTCWGTENETLGEKEHVNKEGQGARGSKHWCECSHLQLATPSTARRATATHSTISPCPTRLADGVEAAEQDLVQVAPVQQPGLLEAHVLGQRVGLWGRGEQGGEVSQGGDDEVGGRAAVACTHAGLESKTPSVVLHSALMQAG